MHFDMSVNLGNIIVNSKANKSDVDRLRDNMQVIMQKLESAYVKLDEIKRSLDEIKCEMKEQETQIDELKLKSIKIETEHEVNHK